MTTQTEAPPVNTLRWLDIVGWVEFASLVVLLVNLATAHLPAITSGVGPVHGVAYLVAIALAWFGKLPWAARLWSLVPGVGALIAYRTARNRAQ